MAGEWKQVLEGTLGGAGDGTWGLKWAERSGVETRPREKGTEEAEGTGPCK